jgi:hypothetical protein
MDKYQAFQILKESGHKLIKEARETIKDTVKRSYLEVEGLANDYISKVQKYFIDSGTTKYEYSPFVDNYEHLSARPPYAYISAQAFAYIGNYPALKCKFYYYNRKVENESRLVITGYLKDLNEVEFATLNWRDYDSAEDLFEDTKEIIEKVTNYWLNQKEEEKEAKRKEKQDRIHHVKETEYPETEDIDEILSVKDGGTGIWTIKKHFSQKPASVKFANYAQAIAALYYEGGYTRFEIKDSDQYLEDSVEDIKSEGVDKVMDKVAYESEDRGQRMYDYIIDPDGNKWWSIWTRH